MRTARALFRAMLVEEWRLHGRLFGGRRFAAMPLFVAAMAAGAVELLVRTGTDLGGAVAGLHALAFVVGLQTGTVGLVSRDAIDALLGDLSVLLSTTETLPIARRTALGVFLLKDLLFYALLFLLPLSLALAPAAARGSVPVTAVPRLWVTVTLTFALGAAVTLAAIALRRRGRVGRAVLGVAVVAVAALLALRSLAPAAAPPVDPVALTPYALYSGVPTVLGVAAALAPTAVLAAGGVLGAGGEAPHRARRAADEFGPWRRRLRDRDGLLTKTLLDVHRSNGGLAKVGVSAGVILLVAVALVAFAGRITGRAPAPGVSVGALLALSAFTTVNWLTQYDGVDSYAALPVSVAAVFRAKFRAFVLLGPAVGLAAYAVAAAWLRPGPLDALAGVLLVVGLQTYLYGVTVYVAGLRPNEFLFDTVLFAAFTAAVAVVLVPVLVAGFVLPVTPGVLTGLAVASVVVGAAGLGLARRAPARWAPRYRE